MTDNSDERLAAIEIQLAHQAQSIDDLSDVIAQQWSLLEALKKRLETVETQVHEVEGAIDSTGAPEPPPPHY